MYPGLAADCFAATRPYPDQRKGYVAALPPEAPFPKQAVSPPPSSPTQRLGEGTLCVVQRFAVAAPTVCTAVYVTTAAVFAA